MINWRVRIKNRAFWLSLIPAALLLVQQALRLCGVDFDPGQLEGQLTGLIGTVFSILALLGIVADPTTPGIRDCCEKHAAEDAENLANAAKISEKPTKSDETPALSPIAPEKTENQEFSDKKTDSPASLRRKRQKRGKIRQNPRIHPNIRREPPKGGPRP